MDLDTTRSVTRRSQLRVGQSCHPSLATTCSLHLHSVSMQSQLLSVAIKRLLSDTMSHNCERLDLDFHARTRTRSDTSHARYFQAPIVLRHDPRSRRCGRRAHAQVHHQPAHHQRTYPAKLTCLLALKSGYSPSPSPTARSALACKLAAIPPHVSKTSTPAPPPSDVQYNSLIQPALIRHEITSTPESQSTIARARWTASRINAGEDAIDLLVYRGLASIRPGSPHDYRY